MGTNGYYETPQLEEIGLERRDFLKLFSIGTVAAMAGQVVQRPKLPQTASVSAAGTVPFEDMDASVREIANSIEFMSTPAPNLSDYLQGFALETVEETILATTTSPDLNHYLDKMANFENPDHGDVYLEHEQYPY